MYLSGRREWAVEVLHRRSHTEPSRSYIDYVYLDMCRHYNEAKRSLIAPRHGSAAASYLLFLLCLDWGGGLLQRFFYLE